MRSFLVLVVSILLVRTGKCVGSEPIHLPVTKDNSIVMVDGEWEQNAGQQGRIRIKGNQHMVAFEFDTSAIAGKKVKKATLVCTRGDQDISGITVSTIAAPWDENRSNGISSGVDGILNWGYPDARFPAVCGGNSFTLVHQSPSELKNGVYHWDIPPDMVHAMSIGVAYGLAIHEHEADYGRNPTIFSKEQSGKRPYLAVELDGQNDPAPEAANDLVIVGDDVDSAKLLLTSSGNGFAYEVTVNDRALARHNIPLVLNNQRQAIPLRDLPSEVNLNEPFELQVTTLNREGQRSKPAVVKSVIGTSTPSITPQVNIPPKRALLHPGLSVIPVTDKYDSAGRSVGMLADDYRDHNPVFDGQRVRLVAAAGEVVSFQLLLKKDREAKASVSVELDDPKIRVDLFQAVYVPSQGREIPDPLLPMPQSIDLHVDKDQALVADLFIPFESAPGVKRGTIKISDGRNLPLEIVVLPFALPRKATFFCEMNSYGMPDKVDDYYALQQIAYDHRVHCNIMHYSHNTAAAGSRKSNLDMRLRSGRRMDNKKYDNIQPGDKTGYWDDFSEAFGPFLDGSLFQNGHRGPVPAPGFYLTFHESWPLNCREFFDGNPDAYLAFNEHPAYAETYVNILRDFAKVANARGWRETGFQVYFNNKGSLSEKSKAPWILDEPSSFWDYRALQFYGGLTDQGHAGNQNLKIQYRVDISRPEYCRGQLDGRSDLWVVATSAFQNYRRLIIDRIERDQLRVWIYGTSNHIHETNRNIQAWAVDSWQHGAEGIVPWQTVNKSGSALVEADQLGLFIFDTDSSGETTIRHSMRLKAYRDAQQMIEYLNLLKNRRNWTPKQMQDFVHHYVQVDASVTKTNEDDAGTTSFNQLSASGLEALRAAAIELLLDRPLQ
jgi:hypothetical protein